MINRQQGVSANAGVKIAMTVYREQRGSCLIETGALDLQGGRHWKPWLRLTRCAGGVSASHTFDELKPVFGTEQAALRYADELGSSLADEGAAHEPAGRDRKPGSCTRHQTFARTCAYRLRTRAFAFAKLIFPAAQ